MSTPAPAEHESALRIPTARLTLVGVHPTAARDLHLGGHGGFTWVEGGPFPGTQEAAEVVVEAHERGVHRPEFGLFALVRRADGRAVGAMGFHSVPDEEGRVEVGYGLAETARGQGYATEALRALTRWALARDDVRSVFAVIERGNTASRTVASRSGFRQVSEDDFPKASEDPEFLAYELRPRPGTL
jgi:RimJ/RimL family protein N-acetyltransferase